MDSKNLRSVWVYQIKIKLYNTPVWRRIEVRSNISLAVFHQVLQIVMGWSDLDEHRFFMSHPPVYLPMEYYSRSAKGSLRVSDPVAAAQIDETTVRLAELLSSRRREMMYEYNYLNSHWPHDICLERSFRKWIAKDEPFLAQCLQGKCACFPEPFSDERYQDLMQIMNNENRLRPSALAELLGDVDLLAFDCKGINAQLAILAKNKAVRYDLPQRTALPGDCER